jgi:hypothetical protein
VVEATPAKGVWFNGEGYLPQGDEQETREDPEVGTVWTWTGITQPGETEFICNVVGN